MRRDSGSSGMYQEAGTSSSGSVSDRPSRAESAASSWDRREEEEEEREEEGEEEEEGVEGLSESAPPGFGGLVGASQYAGAGSAGNFRGRRGGGGGGVPPLGTPHLRGGGASTGAPRPLPADYGSPQLSAAVHDTVQGAVGMREGVEEGDDVIGAVDSPVFSLPPPGL